MGNLHRIFLGLSMTLALLSIGAANPEQQPPQKTSTKATPQIEQGRYLVKIAGCNDCHTPDYSQNAGNVPEKDWLIGDKLGWRGPWGTTYAVNLRISMNKVSEDDWVRNARSTESRPPMPWFALRDMRESDLRAIYRFVKTLGPAGTAAPPYLPPDQEPEGMHVLFPEPPQH